jgi:hypothetical protein
VITHHERCRGRNDAIRTHTEEGAGGGDEEDVESDLRK